MTHTDLTVADEASGFVYLEDDAGKKVLTVYGCSAVKIERAHRLALCWNTHDDLLAALVFAEGQLRDVGITHHMIADAIKAARP